MCINEGGLAALGSGPLGGLSRQLPPRGFRGAFTLDTECGFGGRNISLGTWKCPGNGVLPR